MGADEPNSTSPGVFFGKGFGDLPDGLAWLRPFAITGAFVDELPFGAATNALGFNAPNGKLQPPRSQRRNAALGLVPSVQHLLPDQPLYGGRPKESLSTSFCPLV